MANLRWGILSTADIGRTKVIPAIQRAHRCDVVAIASRDPDVASRVATELGIPGSHGSYEELLADPNVDAVYIPLPNHLHREWTIAAARAGKHVLCEKPLAMRSEDAQQMVDACADAGVVLMEAFMYRLHPSWVAARQEAESGRIGPLTTIQSWFSYYNDNPANIRNIREVGGGALYDIGSYCVNLSRMLFTSEPTSVKATVVRDPVMRVDILTSAILEFSGGRIASFTCSTRTETDQRVHIYGTQGRIEIEIPFNIPPDRETRITVTRGAAGPVDPPTETLTFPEADPYTVQAEHFATVVLDGAQPAFPASDAVANLRVIEKIFEVGGQA